MNTAFFNFTSYPMQVVSSQIEFFFTFAFSTDTSPLGSSFSYRSFSLFILLILYHIISKKNTIMIINFHPLTYSLILVFLALQIYSTDLMEFSINWNGWFVMNCFDKGIRNPLVNDKTDLIVIFLNKALYYLTKRQEVFFPFCVSVIRFPSIWILTFPLLYFSSPVDTVLSNSDFSYVFISKSWTISSVI